MDIILSVITVDYNGFQDTCDLLDSLPSDPRLEVIVVDNASREDEAARIASRYPHVRTLRSPENLGFAGGNNLGIRAARGRYLFFVNNDTVFLTDPAQKQGLAYFQPLLDRLASSPHIGVVCPKIRFAWGDHPLQFAGYTPLSPITLRNHSIGFGQPDEGQFDTPHPTPYAHGAAMMVKREALERTGLMPECYFLYYEELDWSMMFARQGYTLWYEPSVTIYHKESQSTGQDSPLKTYYITRNRLLLARRNVSFPLRLLSYAYLIGLVALRDLLRYALQRRTSQLRAVCCGIGDFLRGRQGKRIS